jgi:hypothetical protein
MKQQQQTTPNYINFDRHEVYTKEMLDLNMDLISVAALQTDKITNSLYGLFDGYLYNSLRDVEYLKSQNVSEDGIKLIQSLISLIDNKLK